MITARYKACCVACVVDRGVSLFHKGTLFNLMDPNKTSSIALIYHKDLGDSLTNKSLCSFFLWQSTKPFPVCRTITL